MIIYEHLGIFFVLFCEFLWIHIGFNIIASSFSEAGYDSFQGRLRKPASTRLTVVRLRRLMIQSTVNQSIQ